MRVLGVYLGDIGPIDLIELYFYLDNPNRFKHLYVAEYDPKTHVERRVPITESKVREDLLVYLKVDQMFRYFRATSPSR